MLHLPLITSIYSFCVYVVCVFLGFHAPTLSFPVAGTLMIEPTESESVEEMDRLCDSLIQIRAEMVEHPTLLKNAPHTVQKCMSAEWKETYTREQAAFPLPHLRDSKVWPTVGRIDNVYGDRNLMSTLTEVYKKLGAKYGGDRAWNKVD